MRVSPVWPISISNVHTRVLTYTHTHKHTWKKSLLTKRLLQTRMMLEPRKYQLIGVLAMAIMITGERQRMHRQTGGDVKMGEDIRV